MNITHRTDDTELVKIEGTKGTDNWLLYVPAILGVTAGRLMNLNGITTLYAGRFFMMFAYLLFAYLAIRKIPVGKAAMFLIVLSPVFIQQSCSYSYDALPIELSMWFVAELFSVLYEDRKIKRRDLIVMAILAFLLASCKAGTYIPECLLFFLIPKEKFVDILGESRHDISLVELQVVQREYGISVDALMAKAAQLNVITRRRYQSYFKKKNALPQFKTAVEKSLVDDEHTNRFERLVYRALASEVISTSKAASLLNCSVEKVRDNLNLL